MNVYDNPELIEEHGAKTKGKINVWKCQSCGGGTVAIDRHAGVTPFIISCGACGSESQSSFYNSPQNLTPAWEWVRPERESLDLLHPSTREHCIKGGLILRPIAAHLRGTVKCQGDEDPIHLIADIYGSMKVLCNDDRHTTTEDSKSATCRTCMNYYDFLMTKDKDGS